ncbi:uncharacterized protein MONOS_6950 [Monocercomonoides exilis]|uniref:uncharacterized protein n=1 Tax=Monocercomonoides exilis TaxID=2049356 RepID=UPI00355981BF|nr:hypothetical protein MONOS_6950 [Monocercomonoides exilis]|eukprot:MONOS_6950.1-p1 / transcript=MONOS_6950.1 / gene=MONOS_6950 / organism=Monocercomonoides_exilis_PA203 / gene_product=unspecified product / transcript_product=unspecified product / location=Mono_scaffold00228:65658-69759(-) / protein_length=1282 / sequence_SO=supercontig / SO=protein_coding / is_pseudo=false
MLSNSTLGVGLAAEPNSATLTGGPTSSFPSFSETFPSPSSIPSLPSSSQVAQEVKEDSIDSDSPEDQGINLENSFFDIFGRSPEISLYDMPLPENEITEIVSALKREDLSPFLPNAPPPFSRTTSPYKDALDRAGERAETFLYPMMKLLLSSHAMTSDEDPIRKMIADACLLLEKALKEARHVRIQARFGFTEAAKMKDEFSSTLLTKRQAELLEESKKQEIKEHFFVRSPGRLPERETRFFTTAEASPGNDPGDRLKINYGCAHCWGQNCRALERIVKNRWSKTSAKRRICNLEEQTSAEKTIQPKHQQDQSSPIKRSAGCNEQTDTGAIKEQNYPTDPTGESQEFKSSICYKKEDRRMETDNRLQGTEQSRQIYPLQIGRFQNIGKNHRTAGLCGNNRSAPSLLSCKDHCLPRRRDSSPQKSRISSTHSTESRPSFQQVRASNKRRKKPIKSLSDILVPRLYVGHKKLHGTTARRKGEGINLGVSQMGKKSNSHKSDSGKRFGCLCRKTQFDKIRLQGGITSPHTDVSSAQQECSTNRMVGEDENNSINNEQSSAMDIETETEPAEVPLPSIPARSNLDNRRVWKIHGSLPLFGKYNARLSSFSPSLANKTKFKLSRVVGNLESTKQFSSNIKSKEHNKTAYQIGQFNIHIQHQPMECRIEPEIFNKEDLEVNKRKPNSSESATHPRNKKHKSGFPVKAGKRRRLRNQTGSISSTEEDDESEFHSRCVCNKIQSKGETLVRSRKPCVRRRASTSMGRRNSSSPSSNPSDCTSSYESNERESACIAPHARLERTDLGASIKQNEDIRMDMEEPGGSDEAGALDETNRSQPSARKNESCSPQPVTISCKEWFKTVLEGKCFSNNVMEICKSSLAQTTWEGYMSGLSNFGSEWAQRGYGPPSDEWSDWVGKCSDIFITLRDRGMKVSSLCQTRSAVSMLTQLLFDRCLGEFPLIKMLFRSFKRAERRKKKDMPQIWNPKIMLDYIISLGENSKLQLLQLTKKTICLCMLFSACRFTELERIDLGHSSIRKDSIALDTSLKTTLGRTDIIIPFLIDSPLICPASAVRELWERLNTTQANPVHLFVGKDQMNALSARSLRKLAKDFLIEAGVPEHFGPYSLKHASISALTMAGVPVAQIARFARLSPKSDTISRHHFRSDVTMTCAKTIACQTNTTPLEHSLVQHETLTQTAAVGTSQKQEIIFDDTSDCNTTSESSSESDNCEDEIDQNDKDVQTPVLRERKKSHPEGYSSSAEAVQEKTIQLSVRTRYQCKKELLEKLLNDDE